MAPAGSPAGEEDRTLSPSALPKGSAEALAAHLTERFWMRLRMFAVRRLRDRNAAEDVAQETIRRVLEALPDQRIRNLDALPAFVFQTARNICLHEARSARREGAALFLFGRNQATTTGPEDDPVTILIDRARREEVRAATQQLGPEPRAPSAALRRRGRQCGDRPKARNRSWHPAGSETSCPQAAGFAPRRR